MVTVIGITLVALWALVIYGINRRHSDRVRPGHVTMAAIVDDAEGSYGVRENPTTDPAYMSASFSIYHHDD